MSDMTGCESGKYAETVVKIKNNADDESDISLMGNENQTNDITINGLKYNVKYTMPSDNSKDPAEGKIYATCD